MLWNQTKPNQTKKKKQNKKNKKKTKKQKQTNKQTITKHDGTKTPPLGQDMTQGQKQKKSFPSPRQPRLKNLVRPTIYP